MDFPQDNAQVSCLSTVEDLENACKKYNLRLSEETNRDLLIKVFRNIGPSTSQRIFMKCKLVLQIVIVILIYKY